MSAGGSSEPNLTPFIDLFSVMICFLLMTAAWIQLESVQVQVDEKPKLNPDQAVATPPPEEKPEKKVKLSLQVQKGKVVAKEDDAEKEFPIDGLSIGSNELSGLLSDWRKRFPEKHTIILNSSEKATYGQLIRLYDVVTASGWSEVAINPY